MLGRVREVTSRIREEVVEVGGRLKEEVVDFREKILSPEQEQQEQECEKEQEAERLLQLQAEALEEAHQLLLAEAVRLRREVSSSEYPLLLPFLLRILLLFLLNRGKSYGTQLFFQRS